MINHISKNISSSSGQIAVIILLIMVVLMTVGLSVVTRTTQEIYLSDQETESARVFNAAEAGLELALSQDFTTINTPTSANNVATGVTTAVTSYTIQPVTSLETTIIQGEAATVSLAGVAQGSASVVVRWGKNKPACTAASLILTLYYLDSTSVTRSWTEAIAPSGCDRGDEFDPTLTSAIANNNYNHEYTFNANATPAGPLPASTTPLFLRIRPVYYDAQVWVTGTNLPVQQHVVRSTSANNTGDEERIIEVARSGQNPPSIMDYALYSGNGILKP
jgi:Tfp pilus assembly protein PilX